MRLHNCLFFRWPNDVVTLDWEETITRHGERKRVPLILRPAHTSLRVRVAAFSCGTRATKSPRRPRAFHRDNIKQNTNIFLLLLKQVAVIVFSDILQSSFLYIRLPVLHGELLFRYRDHVKLLAGQLSKLWSDVNSSVICFEIRPFSVSLKNTCGHAIFNYIVYVYVSCVDITLCYAVGKMIQPEINTVSFVVLPRSICVTRNKNVTSHAC